MNERVVKIHVASGEVEIIDLEQAVGELSGLGLYFEVARRLRRGEALRLPDGRSYRALSAISDAGVDQLPPCAVN